MPNDQASNSKPEHTSPGSRSVTSVPHTPTSESGAKPEPLSLSSTHQASEAATHTRVTWPVPHIMVYYGDIEYAYGRQAIAATGKMAFLEWLYRSYVWTPKTLHYGNLETYQAYHFRDSRFKKKARILGTFYDVHGASDTGPVKLSGMGWAEMMQNVVKLELIYDELPDENPDEDEDGGEKEFSK